MILPYSFNQRTVSAFSDPTSDWNIFGFHQESSDLFKFMKLHIDLDGQFEETILPRTVTKYSPSVGIPERSEIWYFTEKILRFNAIDETWTEFNYPKDLDTDFDYIYAYPVFS